MPSALLDTIYIENNKLFSKSLSDYNILNKHNKKNIDISENEILKNSLNIMKILLEDRTTKKNIIWATSDYSEVSSDYQESSEITTKSITGKNQNLIQPRVWKSSHEKTQRTKNKAEVFTPSWICNKQNNLIDHAWFERENVFNTEQNKIWITTTQKIEFSQKNGRTWQDYIKANRLEITCGEAPYLVSRYDAVTGEYIPVQSRIGLLDRKLRVVNENTKTIFEWLKWVEIAFKSIYGYEYQGDNLLLARENLLYTFIDYYQHKSNHNPSVEQVKKIAEIISWNIWQMDGLTNMPPLQKKYEKNKQLSIFESTDEVPLFCLIKDWELDEIIEFNSLFDKK